MPRCLPDWWLLRGAWDDKGADAMPQADPPGGHDEQERDRQQIVRLLGFPGVGPLPAGAITSNLGVPADSLDALLETLVRSGRLVRMNDGRFALPAGALQA